MINHMVVKSHQIMLEMRGNEMRRKKWQKLKVRASGSK